MRHGFLPAPTATCSAGDLWDHGELMLSRVTPNPILGAIAPVNPELGVAELARGVYVCPDRSGAHIGWASPSVIGQYERGGITTWYRTLGIVRFAANSLTPADQTSTLAPTQVQLAISAVQRRRERGGGHYPATVFVLEKHQPLGSGPVNVGTSSSGSKLGLRQGKLLRVDRRDDTYFVGAPGNWLELTNKAAPYTLPDLDSAFLTI